MLIKPDLSEVAEAITPGTYKGIIKKVEVKEWPKGGQYLNCEVETFGEAEAKNNGRRIFVKTPVSGGGAFRLQELYRAATGAVLKGEFDTETLVGKQIAVEMVDGVNRQTNEPTGYVEVKKIRAVTAMA